MRRFERVAQRVRQGGHHIPDAVARRRYAAGIANFASIYKEIVDDWALYDNAVAPRLLDWGSNR
jgi:predicted ABC-type ATPase